MTPLLLALLAAGPVEEADADPAWLHVRGGLPWTHDVIGRRGAVRVVFLGGSITEAEGFRPLVERDLRDRFPEVEWSFVNAGVSSTGSTTALFRFQRDAVRIDGELFTGATLVILDAAVNDDQDERLSAADAGWGVEGLARMGTGGFAGIKEFLFAEFPNPAIVAKLRAGEVSVSVAAQERVAEHYRIPTANIAAEVTRRIGAGELTWEEYGGTHPGPAGHRLAAEMIVEAIVRSIDPALHQRRRWQAATGPAAAGRAGFRDAAGPGTVRRFRR